MPKPTSNTGAVTPEEPTLPNSDVTSPKRGETERTGLHAWHPYYAGFSEGFVRDILSELGVAQGQVILDPMNGSGTTTLVAQTRGLLSIGVELNPAMAVVARAKDATLAYATTLQDHLESVLEKATRAPHDRALPDHAAKWLPPHTFSRLKGLQLAIAELDDQPIQPLSERLLELADGTEQAPGGRVSDLLRAALLIVTRRFSTAEDSKNPTWPKPSAPPAESTDADLLDAFASEALSMLRDLQDAFPDPHRRREVLIATSDARELPLPDSSVDAVVTSPPYLTRIDYAVGTAPELVLLGYESDTSLRHLRGEIMGSTCVAGGSYAIKEEWGATCRDTVERVRAHPSKASSGYYFKMHIQYFRDAYAILSECLRVLRPGAAGIFVLQDSWYKDIHIQLDRIYVEMALGLGASRAETIQSEAVKTHLGLVNTAARRYKKGALHEHVVMIRR